MKKFKPSDFEKDWEKDLERRGVFEPEWVSDCCGAKIDLITTVHGENPKRCRHCKKPCQIKQLHDIRFEIL